MDLTTIYLIYLIIYRVSIIGAGIFSIYLGYRLFCRGVWPKTDRAGTDIDGQFAGNRFSVKNAAPGTCFAIFGVVLICTFFFNSSPELMIKEINNESKEKSIVSEVRLRGKENSELKAATLRGLRYEENKDFVNAITAYEEALSLIAEPMNNLAWLYHQHNRNLDALPIARIAVKLAPNNANYLDTLAEILVKNGKRDEAIFLLEKAAKINPSYTKKLHSLKDS